MERVGGEPGEERGWGEAPPPVDSLARASKRVREVGGVTGVLAGVQSCGIRNIIKFKLVLETEMLFQIRLKQLKLYFTKNTQF